MQKKLQTAARAIFGFFSVLIALILFAAMFLAIAEGVTEEFSYIPPLRPREDISAILEKEMWTEEDFDVLYHQTGLTRPALIDLKGETEIILTFQDALYRDWTLGHEMAAFTTPHDILRGYEENGKLLFDLIPLAPLEEGDVLVTSSCHTFGWRNGHAAIVTDASFGTILQCVGPGLDSAFEDVSWFQYASNFMLLRLKDKSVEERREIAQYASAHLRGIPYSLLTGIFSPKDQGESPKTTHCSHLVWQAYKYFGYDIDSDGGPVCTARDIACCDLFEVVQVFGFDQDKLW